MYTIIIMFLTFRIETQPSPLQTGRDQVSLVISGPLLGGADDPFIDLAQFFRNEADGYFSPVCR